MIWTPPSLQKLDKLPQITVAECDQIQKYLDWFNANQGIPRTVPPLWQDFLIAFSRRYDDREHYYVEIVHYDDDFCGFWCCHVIDDKKVLTVHSRYGNYDGATVNGSASIPQNTRFSEAWLRNECTAVICTVLAVQMFILYNRPEVIPVELPAPSSPGRAWKSTSTTSPVKKIKDTKRKIIRLSAEDPTPRNVNYKAIQWQVRGHYRHLANGKLIFIKPHTAKRGWKKAAAPKFEME